MRPNISHRHGSYPPAKRAADLVHCLFGSRLEPTPSVILKTAVTATSHSTPDAQSQQGLDLLAAGEPAQAARAFRAVLAADPAHIEAHHGLVRALRDAGRLEASVAAALALIALTPADPLAHTALSISLQHAGHVPEAEAAAARARVLEWKIQLQSPDSQP